MHISNKFAHINVQRFHISPYHKESSNTKLALTMYFNVYQILGISLFAG